MPTPQILIITNYNRLVVPCSQSLFRNVALAYIKPLVDLSLRQLLGWLFASAVFDEFGGSLIEGICFLVELLFSAIVSSKKWQLEEATTTCRQLTVP